MKTKRVAIRAIAALTLLLTVSGCVIVPYHHPYYHYYRPYYWRQ